METYKKYLNETSLSREEKEWVSDVAMQEWDFFATDYLQDYGEDEYEEAFNKYFDQKFVKYWKKVFNSNKIFNEFIEQLNNEIKKFEKKHKLKIGRLKIVG